MRIIGDVASRGGVIPLLFLNKVFFDKIYIHTYIQLDSKIWHKDKILEKVHNAQQPHPRFKIKILMHVYAIEG